MSKATGSTDRTRVRRESARGGYDLASISQVLDAQQICHVAYVVDGEPRIIPTLYIRRDDYIYLHGNRQAALLKHLAAGGFASLSVMSLDGVVVARSGFHCSMNYRSVVVFGHGEAVPDDDREAILEAFVEALVPGHQAVVRTSTTEELNATGVVRLPLNEASSKIRTGPPIDADGDLDAPVWAGVIPLSTQVGTPEPSPDLGDGIALPDYIRNYRPPA
jgi:nitroimidazol reductase NimA-like FMN-containing flavoprotein (pyridoxamine 5'-phosphate oxidase superfamily)